MNRPKSDHLTILPRRRLLGLMAGGGIAAFVVRGFPGIALAQDGAGLGSVESFLVAAYATRARAATLN